MSENFKSARNERVMRAREKPNSWHTISSPRTQLSCIKLFVLFAALAITFTNASYSVIDAQTDQNCITKGGNTTCQWTQTYTPRFDLLKGRWVNFTDANPLTGNDFFSFNGKDNVTLQPFITINGRDVDLSTFRLNAGAVATTRIIDYKSAWKFAFTINLPLALRAKTTAIGFRLDGATSNTALSDLTVNLGKYQVVFDDVIASGFLPVKTNSTYMAFAHANFSTGIIDFDPILSARPPLASGCVFGWVNGTYAQTLSTAPRIGNASTGVCSKNDQRWGAATFMVFNVASINKKARINQVNVTYQIQTQVGSNNKVVWTGSSDNYNTTIDNDSSYKLYWSITGYNASSQVISGALPVGDVNKVLSNNSTDFMSQNLSYQLQDDSGNFTLGWFLDRLTNANNAQTTFKITGCLLPQVCAQLNVSYVYTTFPAGVTLISPPDQTVSAEKLQNFTVYLTTFFGANVKNVTLYGNFTGTWTANATNTSTLPDGTSVTFYNIPLTYDTYIWSAQACTEFDVCAFSTDNYTLTIEQYYPPTTVTVSNHLYFYIFTILTGIILIFIGRSRNATAFVYAGGALLIIAGINWLGLGFTTAYSSNPDFNTTNCTLASNAFNYSEYNTTNSTTTCDIAFAQPYWLETKTDTINVSTGFILMLAGLLVFIAEAFHALEQKEK